MTSGTQGEALGGGWTVPTATVRIFCNVLVVKGLIRESRDETGTPARLRSAHIRSTIHIQPNESRILISVHGACGTECTAI